MDALGIMTDSSARATGLSLSQPGKPRLPLEIVMHGATPDGGRLRLLPLLYSNILLEVSDDRLSLVEITVGSYS